jgi:hypothetical protein
MNFLILLYLSYLLERLADMKWVMMGFAAILTGSFMYQQLKKREFLGSMKHLLSYCMIFTAWVMLGYWWVSLINLILFIFSLLAGKVPVIYVNNEGIFLPSFPKKKIQWNELTNLLLKDDMLTIDFKNNRIIQQLIDEKNNDIDENNFNEFCARQIPNIHPENYRDQISHP